MNGESKFNKFTIASYQEPPAISVDHALETIELVCNYASFSDIVLFPETFLQGYFSEESMARKGALDLMETNIFNGLSNLKPTIILGLNEKCDDKIYNTAAIIENGKVIGKAQKFSTYPPYNYYSLSDEFPVFEKNGVRYGICICCDINYTKPAETLAKHGAQIIFVPMWNIIKRTHSLLPHMHNKAHLQSKATENKVWLVCSDVISSSDLETGVGASCIIDPYGTVVSTAQPLTENLIIYNISGFSFDKKFIGLDRDKQEKFLNEYKF